MKTADLYIRVSTDEQADKGYSQRNQEEVLKKYCSINRITVRKVIFEDHSAKTFNRPQWTGLLADLKKHKGRSDLVLFTKWDRFSRNAGDAYQMINTLRKLGIEPQAIEQPLDLSVPENKMMLAFYLAAPEVENDRRALNVLHGMRRARKEGRWMGPAPFGYENKVTETGRKYIAPYEPEAAVIRWVFNELVSGRQSVYSVWEEARLKGLKCSKNTLWLIIRNPVYCGKILVSKYKDEETQYVKGQHEGIISEFLFYEVQDILDGKRKIYKTKKESQELQLRGFLICPKCGKILTGSASKGRKERYFYYHCVYPCNTRFKAHNANELFLKVLRKFTPRPGIREAYKAVLENEYRTIVTGEREDLKLLKNDLDQIQTKIAKARELLLSGDMDAADYRTIKQEGEKKVNALEARLFNAPQPERNPADLLDKALDVLCHLDQLYEEGDLKRKRSILGSIFPEKLIFNGFYYRITRINEAVRLIYMTDKGLDENKNGQPEENFELSIPVALPGFEPRQTDPESVVLPLYYKAESPQSYGKNPYFSSAMKNLIIILLLLTGTGLRAQRAGDAMAFADSLFHAPSFGFAITEFDFPADIRSILLRFNNAIAANKEWFTAYSSHLTPGQQLPYDEKFGISRGEYDRIRNMDKVHPALKVVDTQRVSIVRQDDRISFKGEGQGRILDYLEFDLGNNVLLFAGDTIPFAAGANTKTAMAYGLFNSYTWRLQRTDVSGGLQSDQLTARVVEIELGLHQSDNKPLLRIQYQDVDHGVSRANLDLAGYIQADRH